MPSLYVVPTPIGNLEDITLRALRVLRDVSLILAEDTRHTRKLLTHYEISTPLLSYHQHNKRARLEAALSALRDGDVAVVSDSGMPSISDPGFELIRAAIDEEIPVDVLPGPNAAVTAVVGAALPSPGFVFAGFLSRRASERKEQLAQIASLPFSLVLYEAPHRLLHTLEDIRTVLGDRTVAVARELTKVHQEIRRGTASEMILHFTTAEPRGEFTLVVAGAQPLAVDRTEDAAAELRRRFENGQDRRTAVGGVTREFGISRNVAYRLWLQLTGGSGQG